MSGKVREDTNHGEDTSGDTLEVREDTNLGERGHEPWRRFVSDPNGSKPTAKMN